MKIASKPILLIAVVLSCGSCSTDFQAWEGRNAVIEGHGGTRKVVDGVDIWTTGDPPRRFRIIGVIEDERPGGPLYMAQRKHEIAQKAREHGGNAVIMISSSSQLQGYETFGSANTQLYGHSATTFGSSTSVAIKRNSSKFLVIKYLD